MSALGHYLEEAGIASVAIALIRPQAENTKPPRALWVPFELGRPIGPPDDAAFQRRVILSALGLLGGTKAESLIVDFPEDDPREVDDPAWQAPANPHPNPLPLAGEGAALAAALDVELRALAPAYAESCMRRERSTVGLSGLAPAACGEFMAAWLRGEAPESPVPGMSPMLALRFAADDLKAFALEAALAGGGMPSSKQLGDWLWGRTALAVALDTIRRRLMASDDERGKLVAPFFVPALRIGPE